MWLAIEIITALFLAIFLFLSHSLGALYNFLNFYLMYRVVFEVIKLIVLFATGKLGVNYWRETITIQGWAYWVSNVTKTICFILIALFVTQRLPVTSFTSEEYSMISLIMHAAPALIIVLIWVPYQRINWSYNAIMSMVVLFLGFQLANFNYSTPANSVVLKSPFSKDAYIVQGGVSSLFNHHFVLASQRHALDMVIYQIPDEESSNYDAKVEDFPCFGSPLFSPVSGTVVKLVSDLPDVSIGDSDSENLTGNYVVIEIKKDQYVMMAHMQHRSINESLLGQSIEQGTFLGNCGNSGNTTEPHLHIQIQDHMDFRHVTKTYPIVFESDNSLILGKSGAIIPN